MLLGVTEQGYRLLAPAQVPGGYDDITLLTDVSLPYLR